MPIVIPSYLSAMSMGTLKDTGNQTNTNLRIGEVKEVVYPTDKRSISKKYIEYVVAVPHQDGEGPRSSVTYSGCVVDNKFGTGGDSLRYTLRVDTQKGETKGRPTGVGAKVILQCINGSTSQAVIVGGIRDGATGDVPDVQADGHNLRFVFHGIQIAIDNDGAFSLVREGPTNSSGVLLDGVVKDDLGAAISFTKDGNVTMISARGDGNKKQQHITLDYVNKQIDILAASVINTEAPDGHTFSSKDGEVVLEAKGTRIGGAAASEAIMMGTTYRDMEAQLHANIQARILEINIDLTTLGTAHTVAGTALTSAAPLNAIPIVGGVAAASFFVAAATSIIQMSATITQMASTIARIQAHISAFEQQSQQYLSQKNFADYQ